MRRTGRLNITIAQLNVYYPQWKSCAIANQGRQDSASVFDCEAASWQYQGYGPTGACNQVPLKWLQQCIIFTIPCWTNGWLLPLLQRLIDQCNAPFQDCGSHFYRPWRHNCIYRPWGWGAFPSSGWRMHRRFGRETASWTTTAWGNTQGWAFFIAIYCESNILHHLETSENIAIPEDITIFLRYFSMHDISHFWPFLDQLTIAHH